MRKGYTITEVLIAVIVLPSIIIILDGLFKTLIKDIPRSYNIVQVNTSLLSMLKEIQQDIDRATGLPETYNEYTAGDNMLLIALPDNMICYQIKDDKVFRCNLSENQKSNAAQTRYWSVPHAVVEWKIWRKDKSGCAVDVRTHIEHKVHGHWERKMANSHLYFVGAL